MTLFKYYLKAVMFLVYLLSCVVNVPFGNVSFFLINFGKIGHT